MRRLILPVLAPALVVVAVAAPAVAQPRLVSGMPAADTSVAPTDRIRLDFSEKLDARSAGAALDMIAMPGMAAHPPMKIRTTSSVGPDGTSLVLSLPKPLPRGTYRMRYHVAGADGQAAEGGYSFTVE